MRTYFEAATSACGHSSHMHASMLSTWNDLTDHISDLGAKVPPMPLPVFLESGKEMNVAVLSSPKNGM